MNGSRERDASIERLLRQSLKAPRQAVVTAACLDAETMAAWVDGGLSGEALDLVQLHVADCVRCQSLVGALARTDVIAAQVEPLRAARWWRLGWLVPLTAAAAAIAVWVAVPTNTSDRRLAAPPLEADSAGKSQNRESVTGSATTVAPEAAAAPRSFSVERDRAPVATAPQELRKDTAQLDADNPPAAAATASARREDADGLNAGNRENAPAPSVAAAPPPATAASGRRQRTGAGRIAPPLAESVGTGNAAVPGGTAVGRIASVEVVSPDPLVRWRLRGAGVERTTDGGRNWQTLATGSTTELTSGSAPSPSICWIVGRGGVVLLSIDGRGWRRLPFPEATDLSGVRATDARAAAITTTDGRAFRTTDAGASWSR